MMPIPISAQSGDVSTVNRTCADASAWSLVALNVIT